MIDYKLVRSERKTLCIMIDADANVIVRAPKKTKKWFIDAFVQKNEVRINQLIKKNKKRLDKRKSFELNYNNKVLFLGREYLITSKDCDKIGFNGDEFFISSGYSSEEIKQNMIKIYKNLAEDILKNKVKKISSYMGSLPSSVKITSAKTRWGSCSGKNGICFSWKLIMASEAAIDSVVVHELAHIKEHNHSNSFWHIVYNVMPDYDKYKLELKELSLRLLNEDWK